MKSDIANGDDEYEPAGKKTRKLKAPPVPVPNRSTRRAHRKHSSDECPLPEVIPVSDGQDLLLFQSYQRETTRLVLQIPLPLLNSPKTSSKAETRVEATPLEIEVGVEAGNVDIKVCVGTHLDDEAALIVFGKYSWLAENQVISKVIKTARKVINKDQWSEVVRFKPEGVRSDAFVVLSLRWQEKESRLYRGLVNQGNTCYMNSYLQMLFHLSEFRRLLFAAEVKEKDRFPAVLQLLFYRMLTQQKSVSPEDLVKSFGWSKKDVQVQHDAQEFSCLFFDALERTVTPMQGRWGSVPELFCGELVHFIQCINVGTTEFRRENRERFYDLQLPIANTLAQALNDYVGETILQGDNAYSTEFYGLQDAHKGLKLSFLPPVMMLQLKRFQFNPFTQANEKVLDRCAYSENIDFSPWTTDPSIPHPYELYAVLVHEGSQASSGHYYIFIHLDGQWYKFNDQRVQEVDRVHALDYNFGGVSQVVQYDGKQMKVTQKQVQNKATAYMLVYLSSQYIHQHKKAESDILPQWLLEHTKNKLTKDEERKARKQAICDIQLLRWKNMLNRSCQGSGLGVEEEQEDVSPSQLIEMVPKNTKFEQWLQQLKTGSPHECPYLLWTAVDRQGLLNMRTRSCSTVSELFKDVPDPHIFFAPISAQKEQFLVLVKVYDPAATPTFVFSNCLTIKKESTRDELVSLLSSTISAEKINFYLEDRKVGLIQLKSGDRELLPLPSPSKNQLLVAVVQIVREGEGVRRLYQEQQDTVSVVFRCETTKEDIQMQLSKRLTARELRSLLFDQLQRGDNDTTKPSESLIKSPQNIVLKYKTKRNGKANNEARDDELLGDLVKIDKLVIYSHSALSTKERTLFRQVTFHCRDEAFRLVQPIKLVVQRAEEDKLHDIILKNEEVQTMLPLKKGSYIRSFLLGKDRSYITDLIDENGRVPGKGELAAVLDRDRNSLLVLELAQMEEMKSQERMVVLLHHVSKTGERFGCPRVFSVYRNMTLTEFRMFLIKQIDEQYSNESLEFQGKTYPFKPFNVRLVAYFKDANKGIELLEEGIQPEPSQGQQAKTKPVVETLDSKFPKNKLIRVALIHNYIVKGSQMLKLNVE